jgi:hypothetical protein
MQEGHLQVQVCHSLRPTFSRFAFLIVSDSLEDLKTTSVLLWKPSVTRFTLAVN